LSRLTGNRRHIARPAWLARLAPAAITGAARPAKSETTNGSDVNLLTRPIIPVIRRPDLSDGGDT
jgi:hypothetical protein